MEYVQEFDAAVKAVAAAQPMVGYWMNWMMFIVVISAIFAWKHPSARLALASMIVVYPIGVLMYHLTGEIHLAGVGHIIVWLPIGIYMIKRYLDGKVELKSAYGVWFVLFLLTITISLYFDIRDAIMIPLGMK